MTTESIESLRDLARAISASGGLGCEQETLYDEVLPTLAPDRREVEPGGREAECDGQWAGDLPAYAEDSVRRAARLEAAGEDLRKRFLRTIRAPGPRRLTRCGSMPPAPRLMRPRGSGSVPRPGTRPPPPMLPAPPRMRCTWPPPRSPAAPCARPLTRSTVLPASPTAGYPNRPRPGTSSVTPPGSSPLTPTSPATAPSPGRAAGAPRRPGRGRRRTPRVPAARRPGCRRAPHRPASPRRHQARPPARPPGRPATATAPSAPKSARSRPHTAAGWPGSAFPPRPARSRLHQGSPDLALAIRPRYADHRHLGHAAPPAEPGRPGITRRRPGGRLSQSPSVRPCLEVGYSGG